MGSLHDANPSIASPSGEGIADIYTALRLDTSCIATVWSWVPASGFLDLYHAGDANNPSWNYITTLQAPAAGSQTLSAQYTLPAGGNMQAVRASYRLNGSADPCSPGNFDDHDDLVFTLEAPAFSKNFSPAVINPGAPTTLTFTLDSTAVTVATSDLGFTDDIPAGVEIASMPNATTTCSGAILSAPPGGTQITLANGSLAAFSNCTVTVDVTSSTLGSHLNTSSALSTSLGTVDPASAPLSVVTPPGFAKDFSVDVSGNAAGGHLNTTGDLTSAAGNSGPASDTLTVSPLPSFGKAFDPDAIVDGESSTLVFTLDNTGSLAVDDLAFADNLPAGMVIATPPNETSTCTGATITAPAGGVTISFSGASLGAAASCTLSVGVTTAAAGVHDNTSGDLTSTAGNSGPASASLTVGAIITVTVASAVPDFDGVCTLREAVTNANNNADTTGGDCVAGVAGDVILLPALPAGQAYTLLLGGSGDDLNAGGDLDVTDPAGLTILGSGPRTSIVDGGGLDRVFDSQPGVPLALQGITVRGGSIPPHPSPLTGPVTKLLGDGGGGIRAQGPLELTEVRIHANASPGDGGGLLVQDTSAIIRRSLFDANQAHTAADAAGGAIAVAGSGLNFVTLEHTTLSGNTAAASEGGALSHEGGGGVTLCYVTVTGNSSGVRRAAAGPLVLLSSIVTGNGASDCSGSAVSSGFNVFGSNHGTNCPAGTDDVIPSGDPGTVVDPLADLGGPTDTHGVYFGSPAIDLVPPATNGCGTTDTLDQRGLPRPDSGLCEAGAYEGAAGPVELFAFEIE